MIKQETCEITSLNEVAEDLRAVISSIEYKAVQYRSVSNNTLKDIGEALDLSLKRVRQIILAAERKMLKRLIDIGYPKYLLLIKSDDFGLSVERMKSELLSKNHFLINVLKKSSDGLIYNKKIGYFFTKEKDEIVQNVEEVFHKNSGPMLLKEFQLNLLCILERSQVHYDFEKIQGTLLDMLNVKQQGHYISKKKFTYNIKLKILFENYITKPLRIDDEGVRCLNSLCENVFGAPFIGCRKTIEGSIRTLRNVILVAPLTYQCIDKKVVDNSI